MAIREFVGLFVGLFVNSWVYSWMAIREYHDLWSFVGLFVDGNSWVYSWMAIRGMFFGEERWAGTRPAPYETRAVREMGGYKTRALRDRIFAQGSPEILNPNALSYSLPRTSHILFSKRLPSSTHFHSAGEWICRVAGNDPGGLNTR